MALTPLDQELCWIVELGSYRRDRTKSLGCGTISQLTYAVHSSCPVYFYFQNLSFFHAFFHNDWSCLDLLSPRIPHVRSHSACCFSHHPTTMVMRRATDGMTIAMISPGSSFPPSLSSLECFTPEDSGSASLVWDKTRGFSVRRQVS